MSVFKQVYPVPSFSDLVQASKDNFKILDLNSFANRLYVETPKLSKLSDSEKRNLIGSSMILHNLDNPKTALEAQQSIKNFVSERHMAAAYIAINEAISHQDFSFIEAALQKFNNSPERNSFQQDITEAILNAVRDDAITAETLREIDARVEIANPGFINHKRYIQITESSPEKAALLKENAPNLCRSLDFSAQQPTPPAAKTNAGFFKKLFTRE